MNYREFNDKVQELLALDPKLSLWGIRNESDGWGGREYQAVIEDQDSMTLIKIRWEPFNASSGVMHAFMAQEVGWSQLKHILQERRKKTNERRAENRRDC